MQAVKKFLKKDNLAFGMVLALLISGLLYSCLTLFSVWFPETFSHRFLRRQVIFLLSIFVNLFPFRTYMVSLKHEKTGRGMLAAMFVLTVMYFIFVHGTENS